MPSSLTWLDYSDAARQEVLDAVQTFREQETRDELGIGAIRDSFADQLFPGTSTIQTRARYFLFIPWIYSAIERKRNRPADASDDAWRAETALIKALLASGEGDGVIGRRVGDGLKRLPSSVYWRGMAIWGIRTLAGSLDDYHRLLERGFDFSAGWDEYEDGERPALRSAWDKSLPEPPDGFPDGATLALTREEADYLASRIIMDADPKPNLIEFLVDRGKPTDGVEFAWQHPQLGEFSPQMRELLEHGRLFSLAMHGAALVYNVMLAQARRSDDLIAAHTAGYNEWASEVAADLPAIRNWDRDRFWQIVSQGGHDVTPQTQRFVNGWIDTLASESPDSLPSDTRTRDLITRREHQLKRGQARLANGRALSIWGGSSGLGRLDYRWGISQILVNEILTGKAKPNA